MTKPKDVHVFTMNNGKLYRITPLRAKRWLGLWPQRSSGRPEELLALGKVVLQRYGGDWYKPGDTYRDGRLELVHDSPLYNAVADAVRVDPLRVGWDDLAKLVRSKLDDLERPNDMRHYRALAAEAKRQKLPTSFEGDLTVHDKWMCERRDPKDRFGWVLRTSGTNVILPATDTWKSAKSCVAGFTPPPTDCRAYFYVWDGRVLMPKTPEEFEAWFNSVRHPPRSEEESDG